MKAIIILLVFLTSCGTIRRPDGYKAKTKCGYHKPN